MKMQIEPHNKQTCILVKAKSVSRVKHIAKSRVV